MQSNGTVRTIFSRRAFVSALLLAGLVATLPVNAADGKAGGKSPTPAALILGITPEDYAPYFMQSGKGTASHGARADSVIIGIVPDALRQIAQRLDRRVVVRRLPRSRLEGALLSGAVDTIVLAREWSPTPEQFLFSDTLVEVRDVVLVPAHSPARQLDDLFGARIGTRLGYRYPDLEAHFVAGRLLRQDADAEQAMLDMLLLGRTSGAVLNERVGQWLLAKQKRSDAVRTLQPLNAVGYRFVFARRSEALLPGVNAGIAHLLQDGSLERILAAYR